MRRVGHHAMFYCLDSPSAFTAKLQESVDIYRPLTDSCPQSGETIQNFVRDCSDGSVLSY